MPFKSAKQRRYMFAKIPKVAKKWVSEGKGFVVNKKKKRRGKKKK